MKSKDSQNLPKNDINEQDIEVEEYVSGEEYREELAQLQPEEGTADVSTKKTASWQQKAAVIFLAIFGVTALILWMVQFTNNLSIAPDIIDNQQVSSSHNTTSNLQQLDTDGDGLSDYNELNFYNTSPYLEDSDSDGVDDKVEIDTGEDPNCPIGQNCFGSDALVEEQTSNTTKPSVNNKNIDLLQKVPTDVSEDDQQQILDVLSGETDVTSLRELLGSAGLSADMLSQIGDEDLLRIYKEAVESQGQ